MLIGALLFLTWLVLLLRYPDKALPVSLAAVLGVALIATAVFWQEHDTEWHLARLELRLHHAPVDCPADRPLAAQLHNGSDRPLLELRWRVAAYAPGDNVDLAEDRYDRPHYVAPGALPPGGDWHACLPLPPLRHGYRAQTVEFRAEGLDGRFAE
ncbi:multidrug transporter [Azotobacter beijerinckii]|uniref:multidrug transporter n=1 Tax=Azotobacter beijerinckii TaxID=170623 RepID=UPI0029531462|nr:multidrug transporter [Azotobacter beijerinckii]MDV7210691.1 multidrug transporter [Azotobacter beijerinckii]